MRPNETEAHCDWLAVCRKSQIPASSFILQFKIAVCEISGCLTWTHRTGNSPNYQFTCGFCILETKTGDKNPNWQWCEDKRQIQEWRRVGPMDVHVVNVSLKLVFHPSCYWSELLFLGESEKKTGEKSETRFLWMTLLQTATENHHICIKNNKGPLGLWLNM